KVPREEIPEGLQRARKEAFEKRANQGNAACTSGTSASQNTVCSEPSHSNTGVQRPGVRLNVTHTESDEKTECTELPIKTCDTAKAGPKPLPPESAQKFPSSAHPSEAENTLVAKPQPNLASKNSKKRPAFSKVTRIKEKLMARAQENAPKPSLFKNPFNIEVSNNKHICKKCGSLQIRLLRPETERRSLKKVKEMGENNSAAEAVSSHPPKIALKPVGHSQTIFQGTYRNMEKATKEGMSVIKTTVAKKVTEKRPNSSRKFHKTNAALGAGRSSDESQETEDISRPSGERLVAPLFARSMSPAKPNRPPHVELEEEPRKIPIKRPFAIAFAPLVSLSDQAMQFPSPALLSHPDTEFTEAPSLPPRNIDPSSETRNPENEENYDDVEFVSQEGDAEMYEDIDDIRSSREEEKQQNKEDEKRMELEKREQKEKENKQLELRGKFKLVGPIEVLHQAQACADYKGGKNELTVKKGDKIEIIRLTDNPEGKWLGRIGEHYGYINTTMIQVDYDSLKRKQQAPTEADVKFSENDMEVYDDVGQQESSMSLSADNSGAGNVLPLPPPPSNQDIYDEIDDGEPIARSVSQDEDKNGIWSWEILKRLKVKDDKKKSVRQKTTKLNGAEDNGNLFTSSSRKLSEKDCEENVYDDVDSSDLSPPPPLVISQKLKIEVKKLVEKDVQTYRKMMKEEKELRKKFKFVGEIKVLFSTTTIENLPKRRLQSKELRIKPGEPLDVIENTDDTKVLCRNEEGKSMERFMTTLVR
ncbi:FYB1 protein, partial [Piprites chloris]|nr:FYB1 protein [Piprites chloris]